MVIYETNLINHVTLYKEFLTRVLSRPRRVMVIRNRIFSGFLKKALSTEEPS